MTRPREYVASLGARPNFQEKLRSGITPITKFCNWDGINAYSRCLMQVHENGQWPRIVNCSSVPAVLLSSL